MSKGVERICKKCLYWKTLECNPIDPTLIPADKPACPKFYNPWMK